ncbi:MAG: 2,3-bisphosphoglycerate-independent phosphoglycerate mutase [Verrucomicrobiae bacterium]|nr:2,3-bisphosphoglycerate-independent phosphoglycerate mutase [Verrucomicrobiae bacterium]
MSSKRPLVLVIRDGWGISQTGLRGAHAEGNATLLAKTPIHDWLYKTFPMATLSASGEDVGLPAGQMGNSEVGHLNLGAGRVVYQDLTRINKDIRDGGFLKNPVLRELFDGVRGSGRVLHLVGLVSDGGVHSQLDHLIALVRAAKEAGVEYVYIHAITDGRDTAPKGGLEYLRKLQLALDEIGLGNLVTVVGRYYAMDRDKRWERTQKGYDCILSGIGEQVPSLLLAVEKSYAQGVTDEFLLPLVNKGVRTPVVEEGDTVLFFNFRSDRGRQFTEALIMDGFTGFIPSYRPKVRYYTMTQYDARFPCPVLYPPQSMDNIFGQVVARAGLAQMRCAETEKYPHVTFFYNGGVEEPNDKEERLLVPSPKVATYDLQPEMSAPELTQAVLNRFKNKKNAPDVVILNFANPDMVGHTGVLKAAIKAVETIDTCVGKVVERVLKMGGHLLITADHGNCERMINPDGSPHTAHTTNLVHLIYVSDDASDYEVKSGILADVSPTMLSLLGIAPPAEMTGKVLVQKK